ncbi:unknown [Tropheryma whipplei str. Twist]|uniref:Uncharacterized protein n=1 Tax=Tropheryma whipplei (strain Twist) TaxID=203267 RepID=Q83GJ8_TROWT|nr:unknown [Tropheryma whipplei str. Twist]
MYAEQNHHRNYGLSKHSDPLQKLCNKLFRKNSTTKNTQYMKFSTGQNALEGIPSISAACALERARFYTDLRQL